MLLLALALITCVIAGPCFPLLNHTGPLYGVQYSTPSNPHVANITDQDYADVRAKGASLFQLSLTWKSIEAVPNQINFDMVADLLMTVRLAKMTPMFNLAVIDTNNVAVPPDLADPNNRFMLAPGLRWTDDVIAVRYKALLDVIAPLVLFSGGFYFGFANEADATLQAVPGSVADDFAAFAASMRGYLQYTTSPLLSCGVTLTVGGINTMAANPPSWLTSLLTQMDATPLTYYPIEGWNATVLEPSLAVEAMGTAISFLPWDRCVMFQELGCPSGYGNTSSVDRSSQDIQSDFFLYALKFLSVNSSRPVAAVSIFSLVDWAADDCAKYAIYYNITSPGFVEYLCTVGMVESNGTQKKSFSTVLSFVNATTMGF